MSTRVRLGLAIAALLAPAAAAGEEVVDRAGATALYGQRVGALKGADTRGRLASRLQETESSQQKALGRANDRVMASFRGLVARAPATRGAAGPASHALGQRPGSPSPTRAPARERALGRGTGKGTPEPNPARANGARESTHRGLVNPHAASKAKKLQGVAPAGSAPSAGAASQPTQATRKPQLAAASGAATEPELKPASTAVKRIRPSGKPTGLGQVEMPDAALKPPSGIQRGAIEGHEGDATPGGMLLLRGSFWDGIFAVGLEYQTWDGTPKVEWLPVLDRGADAAIVKVPESMAGFRKQLGRLFLRRHTLESKRYSVALVPAQEVRVLGFPDGAVEMTSCSRDGNQNCCNQHESLVQPGIADKGCHGQDATIQGSHWNTWGAAGDDKGWDYYRIDLENGWVLHDAEVEHLMFTWEGKCRISCAEGPVPPLPAGEIHWKPGFHWLATSADLAAYRMDVAIIGPKGVPHF